MKLKKEHKQKIKESVHQFWEGKRIGMKCGVCRVYEPPSGTKGWVGGMHHRCYAKKKYNPELFKRIKKECYQRKKRELRSQLINGMGGKCSCCGEKEPVFLCLDHVKGGGRKDYKKRGHLVIYRRVIKEKFPKDKYRLLCWNCNPAFWILGLCPHQKYGKV